MNEAEKIMRAYNRNALIGTDADGSTAMIEDVRDPDGRLYRIKYRSTSDGQHSAAFCCWNPWGGKNGGAPYTAGHVREDGFLCIASGATDNVATSPHALPYVIARARYWCTAFSYFKEKGNFPNPRRRDAERAGR